MATLKPAYLALLASNLFTTCLAIWQDWSLTALLLPFWLQSVILGMFHVRRIFALQHFRTDGFTSNGKPVPETAEGKRSTALFFALHYGFFHLFYLGFILITAASSAGVRGLQLQWLGWIALVLLLSQYLSHRDNVRRDAAGSPNIGGMMFLPYLRILPMHLIIFVGVKFGPSLSTLLIFMGLKTLADLGMQAAEVALQRGGKSRQQTSTDSAAGYPNQATDSGD